MGAPFSCQNTLVKDTAFFPEAKDVFFELYEVDLAADLSKHC
jgi:hypothetical protein